MPKIMKTHPFQTCRQPSRTEPPVDISRFQRRAKLGGADQAMVLPGGPDQETILDLAHPLGPCFRCASPGVLSYGRWNWSNLAAAGLLQPNSGAPSACRAPDGACMPGRMANAAVAVGVTNCMRSSTSSSRSWVLANVAMSFWKLMNM